MKKYIQEEIKFLESLKKPKYWEEINVFFKQKVDDRITKLKDLKRRIK